MNYTPQPGTLAHRIVEHLRAQPPGTTMTSVQLAEALDVDDSTYIIASLVAAVKHGVVHKDWQADNKRLLLWSLGDGAPQPKPEDDEPDEPLNPPPEIPKVANLWPGLATPAPDTRPAKVASAELAWANGAQKNHRGKTPDWGRRRGLPPMETMQTGAPKVTKKPATQASYSDLSELAICDDPMVTRTITGDKYGPIFSKMTFGQCIKCPSKDAAKVAGAMRKWAKVNVPGAMVRAVGNYAGEGLGRVWLLAPAK